MATALAVTGLLLNPGLALSSGFLSAALAVLIATEAAQRQHGPPASWLTLLRWAAGGGYAAFVLAGLVSLFGPGVVPVVLSALAGFIAWYLWNDWQRWRSRAVRADAGSAPGVGDLGELSNAELGQEWRASRARIGGTRDVAELAWLCDLRRRLLDEMERRNPAGFRHWLGNGARDSVAFLRGS